MHGIWWNKVQNKREINVLKASVCVFFLSCVSIVTQSSSQRNFCLSHTNGVRSTVPFFCIPCSQVMFTLFQTQTCWGKCMSVQSFLWHTSQPKMDLAAQFSLRCTSQRTTHHPQNLWKVPPWPITSIEKKKKSKKSPKIGKQIGGSQWRTVCASLML